MSGDKVLWQCQVGCSNGSLMRRREKGWELDTQFPLPEPLPASQTRVASHPWGLRWACFSLARSSVSASLRVSFSHPHSQMVPSFHLLRCRNCQSLPIALPGQWQYFSSPQNSFFCLSMFLTKYSTWWVVMRWGQMKGVTFEVITKLSVGWQRPWAMRLWTYELDTYSKSTCWRLSSLI